jgi:hypothetical protein
VTILLHVPNLRKGVERPDKVIVGGFAIRQVLDPPGSTSITEDCKYEDFYGRGAMSIPWDEADPKCFLTFQSESSKADRDRNLCTPSSSARRKTAKSRMPKGTRQRTSKNQKPYLPEEDELLLELKEKRGLCWKDICKQFPRRKYGSLQAHYAHRLKGR